MVDITRLDFEKEIFDKYIKTLSKLPVDLIEIGYISNKQDDNGPFYHLPVNFKIFKKTNSKETKNMCNG